MPHVLTWILPLRLRLGPFQHLLHAMSQASARRRDRRLLARLDAHLLRDIGLSPEDALTEAAKPFWRP